jgi:2-phospho-L-lactate transferase/gluconeogenesis factor (CofD/UPF0052 family)
VLVDDRIKLDPTFFSVPNSRWQEIGGETYRELSRVNVAIGLALADWASLGIGEDVGSDADLAAPAIALQPAQLALKMHEVAGRILAASAAEEQDLRQVISTLRTALAVCWDLYSIRESETVTVAEHMKNLRLRIEDFERELVEIRRGKDRDEDLFREP